VSVSPELIGILTVGVAVVAVILTAMQRFDKRFERLEKRIDAMEARIDRRIDAIDKRIDAMEVRLASLEKGQARLEGLLDGLREALFERAARSA
jgi:chaperonin cofactor prefoldin